MKPTKQKVFFGMALILTVLVFTNCKYLNTSEESTTDPMDCLNSSNPCFTVQEQRTVIDSSGYDTCGYSCTVKRVSLARNFEDIVLYSPLFGQEIWPGAIVSLKSMSDGVPDAVIFDRKPLDVWVDGLGFINNSKAISEPSAQSVNSGIASILQENYQGNQWQQLYFTQDYVNSYSKEQVGIDAGLGLSAVIGNTPLSLGGQFNFGNMDSAHSVFISIYQHYYTVNINDANDAHSYLAGNVTCDKIAPHLNNDMLGIISSVGYGRLILFQMTNSVKVEREKLAASFKAGIFANGSYDQEKQKIFKSSTIKVLLLGGNPNAIANLIQPDEEAVKKIIDDGKYWGPDSPGVPLIYRVKKLSDELPVFTYGKTTEFTIKDFKLVSGDNLWNIYSFGCDYGHNNSFNLQRNGTPVCGSGNCGGPPNSCWGNHQKAGGTSSNPGGINVSYPKDYQVKGDCWMYVLQTTNIPDVTWSADVGRVWLNNIDITAPTLNLHLNKGWNHMEFTCYNQNNTARFQINYPLASVVDILNSDSCIVSDYYSKLRASEPRSSKHK